MNTKLILSICTLCLFVKVSDAQCPDSRNVTLQYLFNISNSLPNNCLSGLLEKLVDSNTPLSRDSINLFFKTWAKTHTFGNDVLFSCFRNNKINTNRVIFSAVVQFWEKKNGFFHDVCNELVNSGFPAQADTLFSIFDREGKLDVYDWLTWAKVKELIRDEKMVADLYNRVIQREPKLRSVALSQFSKTLQECSPEMAESILDKFRELNLGVPGADTLTMRNWLAETYNRLKLYDQEVKVLELLDMEQLPVFSQLIGAARRRFSQHLYNHAVTAAYAGYRRASDAESRQYAATILYQAYLQQGKSDSAMIWMNRADMKSESSRIGAIVLLQSSGQFPRAEALIDSLRPSLNRDTLRIRQLLLKGDREKAAQFITKESRYLFRSEMNMALWAVRVFLFNGKTVEAQRYLDTLKIQPSWEYARELLSDKYWIQLLQNSPSSLAVWAQIEYNLFTGSISKLRNILDGSNIPKDHKCKLSMYLAKSLNVRNEPGESLHLLSACESGEQNAEYLYLTAEALLMQGAVDSARQVLTKIILENSHEPFSEKARILLSVTGRKPL
ncbi:MAG: hypothetical protein GX640_23230 [Fibrobacter sp.]|nr:hypothetical protein [Fibrobacter sp.]